MAVIEEYDSLGVFLQPFGSERWDQFHYLVNPRFVGVSLSQIRIFRNDGAEAGHAPLNP